MTTLPISDTQARFLRTALSYLLYAHSQSEAAELDGMAARGWFNRTETKVRRGEFKTNVVYFLTPSGRKAAEKLLAVEPAGEGE
jgi:DNA-binding MarR family transcriptional regulator